MGDDDAGSGGSGCEVTTASPWRGSASARTASNIRADVWRASQLTRPAASCFYVLTFGLAILSQSTRIEDAVHALRHAPQYSIVGDDRGRVIGYRVPAGYYSGAKIRDVSERWSEQCARLAICRGVEQYPTPAPEHA